MMQRGYFAQVSMLIGPHRTGNLAGHSLHAVKMNTLFSSRSTSNIFPIMFISKHWAF